MTQEAYEEFWRGGAGKSKQEEDAQLSVGQTSADWRQRGGARDSGPRSQDGWKQLEKWRSCVGQKSHPQSRSS